MRFRGDGWPDRGSSERLLDGSRRPAVDDPVPVVRLLAAAMAPPHPHELAGEQVAVEAFRAAKVAGAHSAPHQRRGIRTSVAAWVAGIAVVATAGVAVAATMDRPASNPTTPRAGSTSGTSSAGTGGEATPDAGDRGLGISPGTLGSQGDRLDKQVEHGLCVAYLSKGVTERGRSLQTAAYQRLVVAAGAQDRVDEYCERLLAEMSAAPGRDGARPGQESIAPKAGNERLPDRD